MQELEIVSFILTIHALHRERWQKGAGGPGEWGEFVEIKGQSEEKE